jgi:hypothetical protein
MTDEIKHLMRGREIRQLALRFKTLQVWATAAVTELFACSGRSDAGGLSSYLGFFGLSREMGRLSKRLCLAGCVHSMTADGSLGLLSRTPLLKR